MLSVLIFLGGCFVFGACIALIWAVLAKLLPAVIKTPFIFFKSARQGVREGREKWQNANAAWDDLHPEPPPKFTYEAAPRPSFKESVADINKQAFSKPFFRPLSEAFKDFIQIWKDLFSGLKEVRDTFRREWAESGAKSAEVSAYRKEKSNFLKNYTDDSTSGTSRPQP